jgi:hypothetical protein
MAANRVSSSIQGDQVPVVGRRPRRTRVIGTILVAGLILGMLAVPVGPVSAEIVEDPCLTCVAGSSIAASVARFNDSGAAALLAAGREIGAGIPAARFNDSGVGTFLATRSGATAFRFSDSGAAALLAAGREIGAGIPAARFNDSGVGAFLATRSEATAFRFNDSGAAALLAARDELASPAAAAADARYSALVAFYAAEYRSAAVLVGYNDSGVAVAFAVP